MRVLFTSVPLVGHFFPLVPLARAMREAGDEVLVACPSAEFAARVTAAGLPVAVVRGDNGSGENGSGEIASYARASVVQGSGERLAAAVAESGRAWGALSAGLLDGMADLAGDFRPDLVVSEPCEFAGRLAAQAKDVPWIEHSWAFPALPGYAESAGTVLPPLPPPAAAIHPCPASLSRDHDAVGMRFVPYNGPSAPQPWPAAERTRPRALVTFGSLLLDRPLDAPALVTMVARALVEAGFELVLALDETLARRLRPWPDGVLHAGWVSLSSALPACDLVIHHGGSGTAMTALGAGLPQLAMPQATDQFATADILAAAGAALSLTPDLTSAGRLAALAVRLIDEPSFRARATELARENAAMRSPEAVARLLHHRF